MGIYSVRPKKDGDQEKIVLEDSFKDPIPKNPRQNLESKIGSLINSLENLASKKARIEFEIKKQKRSLTRKREELKRVSKSISGKTRLALESTYSDSDREQVLQEQKRIQSLLSESARILEE